MTNPRIKYLLREAVIEERQYKLCLIQDVIKIKKHLFAIGYTEHNEHQSTDRAGELFNSLYELDIVGLQLVLSNYTKLALNRRQLMSIEND